MKLKSMRNLSFYIHLCIFALTSVATLVMPQASLGQSTIKFEPSTLTISKGTSAKLKISVDNIKDLYGYQFSISFNANVLEFVSAEEADFLKGDGAITFFNPPQVDNATGKATNVINARLGSPKSISGSGVLIFVTIKGKANGSGKLTIQDAKFSTIDVKQIPVVGVDGSITVGVPATVSLIVDSPEVNKNTSFNVKATVKEVVDLSGYQFDLAYDPKILQAVEAKEGDLLTKDGIKTFFSPPKIDNVAGKITSIASARLGGVGVQGDGVIAIITFKAVEAGKSDIKFQNLSLSDSQAKSIALKSSDSSVAVKQPPTAPWDVNKDGFVNVFDFVIVASAFGQTIASPPPDINPDVNGDGVVNIFDFVVIASHFGEQVVGAAPAFLIDLIKDESPSSASLNLRTERSPDGTLQVQLNANGLKGVYALQFDLAFDPSILEAVEGYEGELLKLNRSKIYWRAPRIDNSSGKIYGAAFVKIGSDSDILGSGGIVADLEFRMKQPNLRLENQGLNPSIRLINVVASDKNGSPIKVSIARSMLSWESLIIPEKSKLGQNYPNPFNPETWIPFELAKDSPVAIRIYSIAGELIRSLNLGLKPAGVYMSKSRAVYWDGRNNHGELVSTGVYFYALETGGFSEVKKMIVVK